MRQLHARMRIQTGMGLKGAATPWYLPGGLPLANCLAAWKPIGAASLAASKVNIVTPGTNDAAAGVNPTFNTATGWYGDGNKYLVVGSGAILTSYPLTFAALFKPDNNTQDSAMVWVGSTTGNEDGYYLQTQAATDTVRMYSRKDFQDKYAAASTTYSAGTWYALVGTVSAGNARAVYQNGANKGTNTDTATPSTPTVTRIGAMHGLLAKFVGYIGAVSIYNAVLDDTQALTLSTEMLSWVA